MKPSEYPEEDSRTLPFRGTEDEVVHVPEEPPRYLDIPSRRPAQRSQRNLVVAVLCLLVAAVALWLALVYSGAVAAQTVVASIGTFGLLWVFNASQVLRQRHGVLLAFSVVLLLGTLLPFIVGGIRKLDQMAREESDPGAAARVTSATLPVPTAENAPPPPPSTPLAEIESGMKLPGKKSSGGASTVADAGGAEDPGPAGKSGGKVENAVVPEATALAEGTDVEGLGLRELLLSRPAANEKQITFLQDVKLEYKGRASLIRSGSTAPFVELSDGVVTFLVNGEPAKVKFENVRFGGLSREDDKQKEQLAMREVMRRYPALGIEDSPENLLFRDRYDAWKQDSQANQAILKNPRWPLILGELLAEEKGWVPADEGGGGGNAASGAPDVKPGEPPSEADATGVPATPPATGTLPNPGPLPDDIAFPGRPSAPATGPQKNAAVPEAGARKAKDNGPALPARGAGDKRELPEEAR